MLHSIVPISSPAAKLEYACNPHATYAFSSLWLCDILSTKVSHENITDLLSSSLFFGCGILSDHWQGALSRRCVCAFTAWRKIFLVCNLDFGVKQLQPGAGEDFDIIELWSKVRPGRSGEASACKFTPAPFSVALDWSGRDEDLMSSHKGEL